MAMDPEEAVRVNRRAAVRRRCVRLAALAAPLLATAGYVGWRSARDVAPAGANDRAALLHADGAASDPEWGQSDGRAHEAERVRRELDAYFALDDAARRAYLDDRLDEIGAWRAWYARVAREREEEGLDREAPAEDPPPFAEPPRRRLGRPVAAHPVDRARHERFWRELRARAAERNIAVPRWYGGAG